MLLNIKLEVNYVTDYRDVYDQTSMIYVHTYIHLGPYFVGALLGYLLYTKKDQLHFKPVSKSH